MQKFFALIFNFLQAVLGPLWILYHIYFSEIDSWGLILLAGFFVPIGLLFFEFIFLFIYHLAADEDWMKRRVPVVQYFKRPENLFFLKSLLFGLVMPAISFLILICYSLIKD